MLRRQGSQSPKPQENLFPAQSIVVPNVDDELLHINIDNRMTTSTLSMGLNNSVGASRAGNEINQI